MKEEYRVLMLAAGGVREGWWTGKHNGVNAPLYARSANIEDAEIMGRREALYVVRELARGWPCKCVPPLTVTY